MQQYLPFTVLKLTNIEFDHKYTLDSVATVLTVYGIETSWNCSIFKSIYVATVLTVYGIETQQSFFVLLFF